VLRQFLVRSKSRPKALVGLISVALANQLSIVALAAGPSVTLTGNVQAHKASAAFCAHTVDLINSCPTGGDESFQVTVPEGAQPCPSSGQGAACGNPNLTAESGVASTPDGQTPCAVDSIASCTNGVLPAADAWASLHGTSAAPVINPIVPVASLQDTPALRLELVTSATTAMPGRNVLLTATASGSITGSTDAIQIFDQTTGTLAGACTRGSPVSYTHLTLPTICSV